MRRKLFTLLTLSVVTGIAYLSSFWLPQSSAERIFESALSVSLLYAFFSVAIEEFFAHRLSSTKTRYGFRKAVSMVMLIIILVVLLRIWIPNPQALLVAYGVVAAGIAIALQDIVKNLAGSITIFLGGIYQVGNRIEIGDVYGDVIDIGLFNTTLLEIRGWISADQATGRITTVPNGAVLSKPVQNYTKSHKYLWDEMMVTVTSESNWGEAMRILGEIGHEHTEEFIEDADKSLTRLERYYYVEGHILDPNVYVQPGNNGYELTLRYVVNAWKRRSTNSAIWGHVIRVFNEHPEIAIAPVTYAITKYPLPEEEGEEKESTA